MKRIISVLSIAILIVVMTSCLVGCTSNSFKSITGISSYDEIEKVVIVHNSYIVDGHVSGAITKTYVEERDILEIYNILSRANYVKIDKEDVEQPPFIIRLYVKGESGYIEYNWDESFKAKDGYEGKLKKGAYSMDFSNEALEQIEDLFYRA